MVGGRVSCSQCCVTALVTRSPVTFTAVRQDDTCRIVCSIVNREAGNSLPALGYTGAYAFANVLLTVAGSVILLL